MEGEAAYAFDFGLTLFANGDLMSAPGSLPIPPTPALGISGNAPQELTNAPAWTDTIGAYLPRGALDSHGDVQQVRGLPACGAATPRAPSPTACRAATSRHRFGHRQLRPYRCLRDTGLEPVRPASHHGLYWKRINANTANERPGSSPTAWPPLVRGPGGRSRRPSKPSSDGNPRRGESYDCRVHGLPSSLADGRMTR